MRRRKQEDTTEPKPAANIPAKAMRVTATSGEEVYSPVQYNSFRVAPVSVEIVVDRDRLSGDISLADIADELHRELDIAQQREFKRKLAGFLERLGIARAAVKR